MFENLIGNNVAKTQLQRLLATDRVPGSMLFAGPEGVGKKQFAYELARAFVCTDVSDIGPCGKCLACVRIDEIVPPKAEKGDEYDRVFFGSHSDVGLVAPYKQNVRVGSIRALEQEANFRPFEGRARIFIIDNADRMNDSAANALLKTLEEPSPTTYIVLVTARPDKLLQTIRSRSQTIRFGPVEPKEIERLLIDSHGFSAADALLASRVSGGSVARAITFNSVHFREVREQMLELIENGAVRNDLATMLIIGEQMNDAKNKDHFEENLSVLETLARDIWMIASGTETVKLTNLDIADKLKAIAARIEPNRSAAWLEAIEAMRQNFVVNINRKIATDELLVKMAV